MAINVEMPFWKAKQQMAQYGVTMPKDLPIAEVDNEPPEPPNVLVDAVSLGGPDRQKPLARHVLVKDFNKIAKRMNVELPKTGMFSHKAPMGLYALFDGHSCAGNPGPTAAEYCARNFHTKLLGRLAQLPHNAADKAAVQAALRGTFEDLDQDILTAQPEIRDGCGAAVALLLGDTVFTAVLGRCSAVLGEVEDGHCNPVHLGGGQQQVGDDLRRLRFPGGVVIGDGGEARLRHPMSGDISPVSRSLGDRIWKGARGGSAGLPVIVCSPEVRSITLRGSEVHPLLLLCTTPVAAAMSPEELCEVGYEYRSQPRAGCGEIAARSMEDRAGVAQCTAVEVCFLPPRPGDEDRKRAAGAMGPEPQPPAKKIKVSASSTGGPKSSMRLRHIMVRFADMREADAKGPSKDQAKRTRQEAESLLRRLINELRKDIKECKKVPKNATELVNASSKKFAELCREHSECESARKGGATCGDLGWVTAEERSRMGGGFKEVVDVLMPGQLSDIAASDQGLHLVQRVA